MHRLLLPLALASGIHLLSAGLLHASPFTIEPRGDRTVAEWKGSAAEIVEGAPTDEDLAELANHPEIEEIVISGCTNLTGKGFAAMKDLPNLRAIKFNGIAPERFGTLFGGDLAGFEALAELKQVQYLNFGHVKVPVEGAAIVLRGMSGLETFLPGSVADDRILAAAAEAPNLKTLGFGHWATVPDATLTMAGFENYAKMPQLESLKTGTEIPADATPQQMFAVLGKMQGLTSLGVAMGGKLVRGKSSNPDLPPLTAADLAPLENLPNLDSLSLSNATFAPDALPALARIPSLTRLTLPADSVPSEALEQLESASESLKVNLGK